MGGPGTGRPFLSCGAAKKAGSRANAIGEGGGQGHGRHVDGKVGHAVSCGPWHSSILSPACSDGVVVGVSANTAVADATSLYLRYEGNISGQDTNHALSAGMRITCLVGDIRRRRYAGRSVNRTGGGGRARP